MIHHSNEENKCSLCNAYYGAILVLPSIVRISRVMHGNRKSGSSEKPFIRWREVNSLLPKLVCVLMHFFSPLSFGKWCRKMVSSIWWIESKAHTIKKWTRCAIIYWELKRLELELMSFTLSYRHINTQIPMSTTTTTEEICIEKKNKPYTHAS